MAKKKKPYLLCMHCGYQCFAKKGESFEELHTRFFQTHVVSFHLKRMTDDTDKEDLPRQKTVN